MKDSVVKDLVEEWPGNRFASKDSGMVVWYVGDDRGEDLWSISDGCWLSGSYESELAAWYAFNFEEEALRDLQKEKNELAGGSGGVITLEDLVLLRVRQMLSAQDTVYEVLQDAMCSGIHQEIGTRIMVNGRVATITKYKHGEHVRFDYEQCNEDQIEYEHHIWESWLKLEVEM